MRHFKSIIEQTTPPATNAIWLHGSSMKYFTNGAWVTIGEAPAPTPTVINYEPQTATTNRLGVVKKASGIALLDESADLTATVFKVNEIISKLKLAGLIA